MYEFSNPENRDCPIWHTVCQNAYSTAGNDQTIDCSTAAICVSTGVLTAVWRKHVKWLCSLLMEYIYQPEFPLLADRSDNQAQRWRCPVQITVSLIMFCCSNKRDLQPAANQQDSYNACDKHPLRLPPCPQLRTSILNPAVRGGEWSLNIVHIPCSCCTYTVQLLYIYRTVVVHIPCSCCTYTVQLLYIYRAVVVPIPCSCCTYKLFIITNVCTIIIFTATCFG
jgi:hypothetical protein